MTDTCVQWWCVVKWTGPCYLGGEWHYCSRLADHIGDHGCECGANIAPIYDHRQPLADALLADPAPEGLSEEERRAVEELRHPLPHPWARKVVVAYFDRLSASTETGEGGDDG